LTRQVYGHLEVLISMDWRNSAAFRRVFAYNQYNRDRWVAAQAAQVSAKLRVLDVGAGRGIYRSLFKHCDYRAHDFGETPETLGEYTQLDYRSDITAIPVEDEAFDVIICTEVLEHVPEPIKAVREIARILRPGGRLLLTAPLGSLLHQEPYHFYGGYTPHWYRKILPDAGLTILSLERNQGFFSMFGQEAIRYSSLLTPWRIPFDWRWPFLIILWVLTLPFLRGIFPLLGRSLDALGLEHMATVGYHVLAVKAKNGGGSYAAMK
jgi:SAM-dependent methyltransferase